VVEWNLFAATSLPLFLTCFFNGFSFSPLLSCWQVGMAGAALVLDVRSADGKQHSIDM
jgi:hypothetical protein